MAKKRFISSILLCAFAIIFAHSIVPHHHHDALTFDQHNATFHDDDPDHDLLERAFSFFQHDPSNGITYEAASPTFDGAKVSIAKDVLLVVHQMLQVLYAPPLVHSEHYLPPFSFSFYSVAHLYRGPPAFVG